MFFKAFVRRFSGAAADMERLKKTTAELEVRMYLERNCNNIISWLL